MKVAGLMSYKEFCDEFARRPLKLVLRYVGRDSWRRPVYECDGRLYKTDIWIWMIPSQLIPGVRLYPRIIF